MHPLSRRIHLFQRVAARRSRVTDRPLEQGCRPTVAARRQGHKSVGIVQVQVGFSFGQVGGIGEIDSDNRSYSNDG
jgi:hypothetical protein